MRRTRQIEPVWLIDGVQRSDVPADDRGLAYGDGLFETIAAPAGQMRRFDQHYERLRSSCERLSLPVPSRDQLLDDVSELAPAQVDHVIKIIVTRGSGGRGYRPPAVAQPRRLVGVFAWPDYPMRCYDEGVRVISCQTRLAENPATAGMKHLGKLEQVLAQQQVASAGADEGIMRSVSGLVISGTMSNLFLVESSRLITPRLDRCGIIGVMRAAVIEAARSSGIDVVERDVEPDELAQAQEAFLTNSLIGIWPVSVLDDIAFSAGPISQSLMRQLQVYPDQAK